MYSRYKIIDAYTDASYSKEIGGSVIGYKIDNLPICIEFVNDIKNTQAELMAIERCISLSAIHHPESVIRIHTDCQKAQKEIYPPNIIIVKVIGHMKNKFKNERQKEFSKVDKLTRKTLRIMLKEIRAR